VLVGKVDQKIHDLQERCERYGFSYIVVLEALSMFSLAQVVERLAGT
jgi:hypothetical protein